MNIDDVYSKHIGALSGSHHNYNTLEKSIKSAMEEYAIQSQLSEAEKTGSTKAEEIESINKSMSEMFRQHDYREMYNYYMTIIKPKLFQLSEAREAPTDILRRDEPYNLKYILENLINGTDKLLKKYAYDGPDYEEMEDSSKFAKELLPEIDKIFAVLSTQKPEERKEPECECKEWKGLNLSGNCYACDGTINYGNETQGADMTQA